MTRNDWSCPGQVDHRFEDDAVAEAFELEQCAATVLGVVAGDEVVATKIGSWCGWFAAPADLLGPGGSSQARALLQLAGPAVARRQVRPSRRHPG